MIDSMDPRVPEFLGACSAVYDRLTERTAELAARSSPEAVLQWVESVATFAGMHHPGRFADGRLENAVLQYAAQLPSPIEATGRRIASAPRDDSTRRRVLHVATTLHGIGGHTRTILHWMARDPTSRHSVLVTSQGSVAFHPELAAAALAAGGELVSLDAEGAIEQRAAWLRHYSRARADLVILHISPADVVPIAAFAAEGPPVGLVNLADQCYWLGSTVADVVIHLREVGATSSRELRSLRRSTLLPIPMTEQQPELTRAMARAELGIPPDQTMLLTIGRSLKYAPTQRHNFFQTAVKILDAAPAAHLYLVGVRAEDHPSADRYVAHPRMHFVGPIFDPSCYQRAADLYLEGFPFGSQTALLESVLPGLPCVLAHSQLTALLATQDFALDGVVDSPPSEQAYIDEAIALMRDEERRRSIGSVLRERVQRFHIGPSWNEALDATYNALLAEPHRPQPIPGQIGKDRVVDLAISEFHATRLRNDDLAAAAHEIAHAGAKSAAYWLRQRGRHAEAFNVLRISRRAFGIDRETVVAAAKLMLHWAAAISRRRPAG